MSTLAVRTAPARLLFWPAAAASLALVAAGTGGIVPMVPFLGLIGLAVLLAAPMQVTACAVLAVALLADNPGERPADGHWASPVAGVGRALYLNLNSLTGIQPLRFSAIELIAGLLLAIVIGRKILRDPIDDPLGLGVLPNPMKKAFGFLLASLVFVELYGLARGGDFKNSLWQIRQLFWMPLLGVLFGNAFKSAGARTALLRTVMAVAWLRCAMGVFFYFAVAPTLGEPADYATTHSDSMLTVVAMVIGVTALAERPSWNHLLLNVFLQPMMLLGLVANNRRLAFVSLAVSLAALVALGPPSLLRFLKRSLIVVVPLILVYVAVGWNAKSGVFKPVAMIRSVSSQEDDSSKTRDIENYNLIQTLDARPVFGSGFGHEYNEVVKALSVSDVFAQYRYIAHNSVLWLLSLSGWVGFTLVWMIYPVALLIALRVHRRTASVVDRVTAFATISIVMCFVLQAWGDMGLQSWMGTLLAASLMGATGAMFTAQNRLETAR